jgi:hypothetical protein
VKVKIAIEIQAGQRIVNGWKNAGLPWTYKLVKAKMYFPR